MTSELYLVHEAGCVQCATTPGNPCDIGGLLLWGVIELNGKGEIDNGKTKNSDSDKS